MNLGDVSHPVEITKENALLAIEELANILNEQEVPPPRWLYPPRHWTVPKYSRSGRRLKRRLQKKSVIFPVFLSEKWKPKYMKEMRIIIDHDHPQYEVTMGGGE